MEGEWRLRKGIRRVDKMPQHKTDMGIAWWEQGKIRSRVEDIYYADYDEYKDIPSPCKEDAIKMEYQAYKAWEAEMILLCEYLSRLDKHFIEGDSKIEGEPMGALAMLGRIDENLISKLIEEGKRIGKAPWSCCGLSEMEARRQLQYILENQDLHQETFEETCARRKEEQATLGLWEGFDFDK